MTAALPVPIRRSTGLAIFDQDKSFVVSFPEVVRACSWAIVHGGLVDARHVAWFEVRNSDLGPDVDPRAFLAARLGSQRLTQAVGLLTSRRVSSRIEVTNEERGVTAHCVATVGLGNALRAGDPSWASQRLGTINLLAHVDVPLTDEGLLEANAIATEAKCAAMFDARVSSRRSGSLATGTGTDCTVVTCPVPRRGRSGATYAGKHTAVGAAIGAAVERAIGIGVRAWRSEFEA